MKYRRSELVFIAVVVVAALIVMSVYGPPGHVGQSPPKAHR